MPEIIRQNLRSQFAARHFLSMLCILARTAYRFKRYQIVIIPDNRIIAGNTYTACYYKSFGINPNNGNQIFDDSQPH